MNKSVFLSFIWRTNFFLALEGEYSDCSKTTSITFFQKFLQGRFIIIIAPYKYTSWKPLNLLCTPIYAFVTLTSYSSVCEEVGGNLELLCETKVCLVDPNIVEGVNMQQNDLGWSATQYPEFWGRTLDDGVDLR